MSGRSTRLFRVGLVAAVTVLSGATASAQVFDNAAVGRTYGSGVHAFFTGDLDRSYDEFTAVIEAGSSDPRPWYFRGLAALKLGRPDEAEADFSRGAAVEAAAQGNWPVSQSLERVQGCDRLQLERHRVRARVANVQRIKDADRKRFRETEAAQPGVLRGRAPEAVTLPRGDGSNPFADQNEVGAGDSGEAPQPEAPAPDPLPSPDAPDATATPEPDGDGLDAEMEKPAEVPAESGETKPDAAGDDEPTVTSPVDEPAPGDSEPPMVEQAETTDPATPAEPAPEEPAPSEPAPAPAEPGAPEPESPEAPAGEPAKPEPAPTDEDPFGDKETPPPAAGADEPMVEEKAGETADGQ